MALNCQADVESGMKFKPFLLLGLVICAAALLNFGSPKAFADVRQENALLSAAKAAHDRDNLAEVLALEPNALKAADAGAVRQGRRLILDLSSGGKKTYVDRPECESKDSVQQAKCQQYRLIAHVPSRGVFVLVKATHEGADYLLVSDVSGDEAVVPSFPMFSPSGQHVLVLTMNDAIGEYAIQVLRREGDRLVLDWKGWPYVDGQVEHSGEVEYKLTRWPSDEVIELQARIKQSITKKAILRHTARGWDFAWAP
jgi:hypothetical protein